MFWLRAKGENRECLDCPLVDNPTSMAIMSEGIGFDDTRAICSNGSAIQTGGVGT